MSDLLPTPVLLAILQNQINNAVDENKVDTSMFPIYKTIGDASALTEEEKNDISDNVYQFLLESSSNKIYVLVNNNSTGEWMYESFLNHSHLMVNNKGFKRVDLRENWLVDCDINGNVTYTEVLQSDGFAPTASVILTSKKYPDVTFYCNYFDSKNIYCFFGGIISDSANETPQYKIIYASYNISEAKVTFVEKVLP